MDEGDAVIELLGTERHEAWLDVPQGLLPAVTLLAGQTADVDDRLVVQVKLDSTGQTYSLSGLRVIPDASRTTRTFSLVGIVDGRLDRSAIPAGPSARKRVAHLRAVGGETMNILAAVATGQCSSTMSLARRRRARGVRAALAWDMKAFCSRERFLDNSGVSDGLCKPYREER